jgi:hypothetical protein
MIPQIDNLKKDDLIILEIDNKKYECLVIDNKKDKLLFYKKPLNSSIKWQRDFLTLSEIENLNSQDKFFKCKEDSYSESALKFIAKNRPLTKKEIFFYSLIAILILAAIIGGIGFLIYSLSSNTPAPVVVTPTIEHDTFPVEATAQLEGLASEAMYLAKTMLVVFPGLIIITTLIKKIF